MAHSFGAGGKHTWHDAKIVSTSCCCCLTPEETVAPCYQLAKLNAITWQTVFSVTAHVMWDRLINLTQPNCNSNDEMNNFDTKNAWPSFRFHFLCFTSALKNLRRRTRQHLTCYPAYFPKKILAMHPGKYSGIHVSILSDSNFGILSGILSAILPRILSDFLPGILSGIPPGNLPGIASTNPCYI